MSTKNIKLLQQKLINVTNSKKIPDKSYSYAGQKRGFEDARGTLFFEFARAIKEIQSKVFLAENVRGLLNHDMKCPKRKTEILSQVPEGGYWIDLPEDLQRKYMMKSYFLGGGKTGMARRLAWNEPSLTLTCSPAQKQTEHCHPEETRPLTEPLENMLVFRHSLMIGRFLVQWVLNTNKLVTLSQPI